MIVHSVSKIKCLCLVCSVASNAGIRISKSLNTKPSQHVVALSSMPSVTAQDLEAASNSSMRSVNVRPTHAASKARKPVKLKVLTMLGLAYYLVQTAFVAQGPSATAFANLAERPALSDGVIRLDDVLPQAEVDEFRQGSEWSHAPAALAKGEHEFAQIEREIDIKLDSFIQIEFPQLDEFVDKHRDHLEAFISLATNTGNEIKMNAEATGKAIQTNVKATGKEIEAKLGEWKEEWKEFVEQAKLHVVHEVMGTPLFVRPAFNMMATHPLTKKLEDSIPEEVKIRIAFIIARHLIKQKLRKMLGMEPEVELLNRMPGELPGTPAT